MVRNLQIGKDDDIPSWRKNGGCKVTVSEKLTTEQRKQLEILLKKFQDVFQKKPGKTKAIQHFIHTTENNPGKQQPYRVLHAYWEEIKQEVKDMLAEGVKEPSQSD